MPFGAFKVFANYYLLIHQSFRINKSVFIMNTKNLEIFLHQILLGTLSTISTSGYSFFVYLEAQLENKQIVLNQAGKNSVKPEIRPPQYSKDTFELCLSAFLKLCILMSGLIFKCFPICNRNQKRFYATIKNLFKFLMKITQSGRISLNQAGKASSQDLFIFQLRVVIHLNLFQMIYIRRR